VSQVYRHDGIALHDRLSTELEGILGGKVVFAL
jgi:hypothetical protein